MADALNDPSPDPLPETIAAERLRQHLEDVARERDNAYRALQEREAELARIQRIGKVGGVEVDFREGFKNRRSPGCLMIHGLPPEAADETHEAWVNRIHPETVTPMVFIKHRELLMRIIDRQIQTLEFCASLLDRIIALDERVNELEGRPDGGNHS